MRLTQSESILKDEIRRRDQAAEQLRQEVQEAEALVREKQEMWQEASDTLEELRAVN